MRSAGGSNTRSRSNTNAHRAGRIAAKASWPGSLRIPTPNYRAAASFGRLELKKSDATEFIGQAIDYSESKLTAVRMIKIDSLVLSRLDLIKIDVERMELEVLEGARATLQRFLPIIIVEKLKVAQDQITAVLAGYGYEWFQLGLNFLAVHPTDPTRRAITVTPPTASAES